MAGVESNGNTRPGGSAKRDVGRSGAAGVANGVKRSERIRGQRPLKAEKRESQPCGLTFLLCSGGRTRTSGLRVMSPTSYQLLYPAMFGIAKVRIFFEIPNFFKNSRFWAGNQGKDYWNRISVSIRARTCGLLSLRTVEINAFSSSFWPLSVSKNSVMGSVGAG